MADSIKRSVDVVAQHWIDSAYYQNAERWTHLWWDDTSVFRRLFNKLDLLRTVELACGHGRHAELAAAHARSLVLIDVHQTNLNICRQRLADRTNVEFILGNGYDFQPLDDHSVTAIYCYDRHGALQSRCRRPLPAGHPPNTFP